MKSHDIGFCGHASAKRVRASIKALISRHTLWLRFVRV